MKLCQRHIDEILSLSDSPAYSSDWIDEHGGYGASPMTQPVPESECEEWAHAKLNATQKMIDGLIEYWRERKQTIDFAAYYVDAYQSVRQDIFGERKP